MHKKPRTSGDNYKTEFFRFRLSYKVLPPYKAPAAISNDIPPSIGIKGGGQHPGPPDGGGGAAKHNELKLIKKTTDKINFALINF
jgi:hypothetical protein